MVPSRTPETTASTCEPETVHGTHSFKISRYSLYTGLGVDQSIESAIFSVGGYDWCVHFYPDGENEDCTAEWTSAYLELTTENAEVRVLYDLRVVNQVTPPPPFAWQTRQRVVVCSSDDDVFWGCKNFMRKSEITQYLLDDTLLLECNIAVIQFKQAQLQDTTKRKSEVHVPPSDLLDNLSDLLEAQDGADVSFEVRGEVFPAHKIILAMRSPVFKAEFYGPIRNKCRRIHVTIEDMQPAVFKAFLHFIYTDLLPPMDDLNDDENEEMVKHLLVAADRYAMERMKLMCESKLSESLRAETVATTLALADQHHCSQLKDVCIDFINTSDRMDDVVASKGYQHLKRACPTIFVDILEKAAKTRKI